MKKLLIAAAAASTLATPTVFAQSAFQGFYGQIATGYESNNVSSANVTGTDTAAPGSARDNWNTSNQSFGGAPLVIGLGYNFSVAPQWLIGIGVDYSALSQKSSTFSSTIPGANGGTVSGASIEASNRFNVFITPGYAIDKDKLVYLKAGYSSLSTKLNSPNYYTDTANASNSGPTNLNSNPTSTVGGYIVGLGYKQIITGGLYGFAEGNYMGYSKPNFSATTPSGYNITLNPSINSYSLLVGVGYKF